MHESSYKLLSTDEKTSLLKNFYVELNSKYHGKETSNLCFLLSEDAYFWLDFVMIFYTLILVIIALKILSTFV